MFQRSQAWCNRNKLFLFFARQLKHKIFRKSFVISSHLFAKAFGFGFIKSSEIDVYHDLQSPEFKNHIFNVSRVYQYMHKVLINRNWSQFATSSGRFNYLYIT